MKYWTSPKLDTSLKNNETSMQTWCFNAISRASDKCFPAVCYVPAPAMCCTQAASDGASSFQQLSNGVGVEQIVG